ncbi:MAG: hypothetical protein Q9209_001943 [Squamulea sp. 1 TL-2023]
MGEAWERVRWQAKIDAIANDVAQPARDNTEKFKSNELQSIRQRISWPAAKGELSQDMKISMAAWREEAMSRFTKADVENMDDTAISYLRQWAVWWYLGKWLLASGSINRPEARFEAEITEQHLKACMLRDHQNNIVSALLQDGSWELDLYREQ